MNILPVLLLPRIIPGVQIGKALYKLSCLKSCKSDGETSELVTLERDVQSPSMHVSGHLLGETRQTFQKQWHGVSERIECVIFIWCFHHEIVSKARQVLMRRFEPCSWNGKNQHGSYWFSPNLHTKSNPLRLFGGTQHLF